MSENGTEQRRCALDDEHAAIDAFREAEDPLTAIDAIPGMLRTAVEVISEALETAVVDAIQRAAPYRELRDQVFDKKDQLRGLLDDYDEKRKAKAEEDKAKPVNPVVETNDVLNREDTKAEAAPEELYDSDWFMWKVATSILGRTTSGREMIPWKTLEAEMRKTLNEQRAKYPTLNERLIVNWDHAKASLERLDRREMLICDFGGHAVWVKYDPQFVEEPEPGFREDGKCVNDVDNPGCLGVTTKGKHGKWKDRFYPRCKPCNEIFQERRDPKPVKPEPEPDNSGTLFENPEPSPAREPVPVPVPASTVMLDANPEADDLAELLRKGEVDEFLVSAGHWYSTRFTRALAYQLKADGAKPSTLQVFWVILTVLEGLDKDATIINPKSMAALSGLHRSTISPVRTWLMDFDYITWDKDDNAVEIGTKLSDAIDDYTPDGKEHWHSTKYTLDVVAQLVADGVGIQRRIMFWAILTTLEGLGIKSGRFQNATISETIARDRNMVGYHAGSLSKLGWITYTPGRRDKGTTPAAWPTFGFGPRLTNE